MTDDEKFELAYRNLLQAEGGYTTGKNQIRDMPTNMGTTSATLARYRAVHPGAGLPANVRDITPAHARMIYKSEYWSNTQIPNIHNPRIRNAVFDMNVMGGAGRVVQRALNAFLNARLVVDGRIGPATVAALNSVPLSQTDAFMDALKTWRIKYLQQTPNWPTAKNGWVRRTNKY